MSKKSFVSVSRAVPLLILLCLLLTGCQCKHEWNPATCTAPQTCSLCQLTEGEALGHTWADATCEAPKTCSVCKATEGSALGHTWLEATCLTPKTCSVCATTEGDALGHTWVEATCQTLKTCSVCKATEGELAEHIWIEATCTAPKTCSVCSKTEGELAEHKWMDATTEKPKTCSVCAKTEGSRIITDSRFKTANCKDLFGTWAGVVKMDCEEMIGTGFTTKAELKYSVIFNHDGSYKETTSMINKDSFTKEVEAYMVEALYKEFAALGLNKEQANAAMQGQYGMDVETYSKKYASSINWDSLFTFEVKGVYYVADGKLHSGSTWESALETDTFTITGKTLSIEGLKEAHPDLVLTRS